ncbi:hypothetical protein JVT61DRAFT_7809 [Boletus reticuloceps]|uniref:Zn(2)-C6 fungal-type domain-containing protein n=1 Tax=Boletus reticuloceps TaxID=495285 RepID=A0A8I2YHI2_9AGAM|nr:hypothetical protein JVT61DRAFT_7809 [Boletus reticuloceps]
MSNALNKLLTLAAPDPNAAKKEVLLTTYNNATGHLVDLLKCAPDNKSELMDKQEMWIAQWEKAMEALLSTSLAISEAGLVLSLEDDVHQAVRQGERWTELWKVHLDLTDVLEAVVDTEKEKEKAQAEAGASQPETEASHVETGGLQLEGEPASTTATTTTLEKETDRGKGTEKEAPHATLSETESRSAKRQLLVMEVSVPLRKRVKRVEEEEPIERQDESEEEEEVEVEERHASPCESCARKRLPCVGRPSLACRACVSSHIKCLMSAGKGKVKTKAMSTSRAKAKPLIKVAPVQRPIHNKPRHQASPEVLTISEDEEGGCATPPKTGKGKVKVSGSGGGDAKAVVGKAISMLMDLQERGLGLRKKQKGVEAELEKWSQEVKSMERRLRSLKDKL